MDVLDSEEIVVAGKNYKLDGLSNLMDRVRHFAIDFIATILLTHLVSALISAFIGIEQHPQRFGYFWMIFLALHFVYYTTLEYFWQKTLGKFFNKTIVLAENESRPDFKQILIRAIIRSFIIGTFLIGSPYGRALHDILSRTYTVRIKKL